LIRMILGLNTEKQRFLRDVQDVQKFALIRTGVSTNVWERCQLAHLRASPSFHSSEICFGESIAGADHKGASARHCAQPFGYAMTRDRSVELVHISTYFRYVEICISSTAMNKHRRLESIPYDV
jgi:hypothetical protein